MKCEYVPTAVLTNAQNQNTSEKIRTEMEYNRSGCHFEKHAKMDETTCDELAGGPVRELMMTFSAEDLLRSFPLTPNPNISVNALLAHKLLS